MAIILRLRGYALLEAGTVAEAMIGLAHNPSWVLLDLMLPDGNGIEVVRRIRETNMTTKVCLVTGCEIEMQDEALKAGANCAIRKPVVMDTLFQKLSASDDEIL